MTPREGAALAGVMLLTLTLALTAAADGGAETLFSDGVAALERGAWDDAIDRFELLADRGIAHPDASYDRAVAYVRRATGHGARSGDLGRAAAALSEALLLRADDTSARFLLERVHEEIARRRARAHAREVEQRPSLGWAVVGLLDEDTWAVLAAVGSLSLALSLAVRFVATAASQKLAAAVVASLGTLVLVVAGPLTLLARYDRTHAHPAVVIADEARLLSESGVSITGPGSILPEGAEVRVTDLRGSLAHVEWGTLDGWVSLGQLRMLARTRVEP